MLVLNPSDFADKRLLVDSSVLGHFPGFEGKSILQEFYSGDLDSLFQITTGLKDTYLRYTDQIFKLAQECEIDLLPEVLEENNVLLEKLNGHYSYFREKIGKVRKKSDPEINEREIALRNLEIICNRIFKLNGHMSKIQKPKNWDVFPQRRMLHLARVLSRDMQRKSEERYSLLESSQRSGLVLETDQKLAASLFLPDSDKDVVLLTRDRGLILLARRIYTYISNDPREISARQAARRANYYDLVEQKVIPLSGAVDSTLDRVYNFAK